MARQSQPGDVEQPAARLFKRLFERLLLMDDGGRRRY
jgi:hypothetical protein